jgi:hypothetical protein
MKEKIVKITEQLENGNLTLIEAQNQLLCLFDVIPLLPTEKEFKAEAKKSGKQYMWTKPDYRNGLIHGFINGCYYCTNFKGNKV